MLYFLNCLRTGRSCIIVPCKNKTLKRGRRFVTQLSIGSILEINHAWFVKLRKKIVIDRSWITREYIPMMVVVKPRSLLGEYLIMKNFLTQNSSRIVTEIVDDWVYEESVCSFLMWRCKIPSFFGFRSIIKAIGLHKLCSSICYLYRQRLALLSGKEVP